jgi:uncharacterized protein
MTSDDIIARLSREKPTLDSLGVASLELFGSLARGAGSASSDADFLVEFSGRADFDRYMDLKLFLENILGRRIDLVTRGGLRPELRPSIEQDALRVA